MAKNVLFVDDEYNVLQGLRRQLRTMRNQWAMHFATGGAEALELMAKEKIDVLVTDMRMPGMDGNALLSAVMERHPGVVRIVLSGHCDNEMVIDTFGRAHQFLSKPCSADELRATVERAVMLRELLDDRQMKCLAGRMDALPVLPDVYKQITRELESPEPSTQAIGQAIENDVALSAKILQMVNSPYFGFRQSVTRPAHAVNLLGLETLRGFVLLADLLNCAEEKELGKHLCLDELWRHSSQVSRNAHTIAEDFRADRSIMEDAFTAGLLHDIGKVVLAMNYPTLYDEVDHLVKEESYQLHRAEEAVFGANHAHVGGYLLGLWGLPEPLVTAVAYHHQPSRAKLDGFAPTTAVHVADVLVGGPGAVVDEAYLQQSGLIQHLPQWISLSEGLQDGLEERLSAAAASPAQPAAAGGEAK